MFARHAMIKYTEMVGHSHITETVTEKKSNGKLLVLRLDKTLRIYLHATMYLHTSIRCIRVNLSSMCSFKIHMLHPRKQKILLRRRLSAEGTKPESYNG